jgi:hypothetical protein
LIFTCLTGILTSMHKPKSGDVEKDRRSDKSSARLLEMLRFYQCAWGMP